MRRGATRSDRPDAQRVVRLRARAIGQRESWARMTNLGDTLGSMTTKVRATGAVICSRCGTRADARRGTTAICLTCGQPFPAGVIGNGARGGGSALPIVLAMIAIGCVVSATVAIFLGRASHKDASPPSTTDASSGIPVLAPVASVEVDASASAKPIAPVLSDAERDQLPGSYTCSMDDSPAFTCRIEGGVLEKVGGSQRFKGPIRKLANGDLQFSGTFFCPFGDCTHPVAATFARKAPGRYVGQFGPNSVRGGGPGGERVVLVKVR